MSEHGTQAGAARHRRLGEPVCDECRVADNEARSARRRSKDAEVAGRIAESIPEPPSMEGKIDELAELQWNLDVTKAAMLEVPNEQVSSLAQHHRWVLGRIREVKRKRGIK